MKLGTSNVSDIYFGTKRVAAVYVDKKLAFQAYSVGLEYALSSDGTYYTVSGTGEFAGGVLKIPSAYNELPVTEIGYGAFVDCINLKSVTIPNSITNLQAFAFDGCANLNRITITKNVAVIGGSSFRNCSNLAHIYYNGTKAQWGNIDLVDGWNTNTGNYTIHCADGDITKS